MRLWTTNNHYRGHVTSQTSRWLAKLDANKTSTKQGLLNYYIYLYTMYVPTYLHTGQMSILNITLNTFFQSVFVDIFKIIYNNVAFKILFTFFGLSFFICVCQFSNVHLTSFVFNQAWVFCFFEPIHFMHFWKVLIFLVVVPSLITSKWLLWEKLILRP